MRKEPEVKKTKYRRNHARKRTSGRDFTTENAEKKVMGGGLTWLWNGPSAMERVKGGVLGAKQCCTPTHLVILICEAE